MSANHFRSRSTRIPAAALTGALAGALLLTGCGGGDDPAPAATTKTMKPAEDATAEKAADPFAGKKPAQIWQAAYDQAKKAKSVHMKASIKEKGETVTMDLSVNRAGRASGSVSTSDGSMKLILMGQKGYFLPGQDMLDSIAGKDKAVRSMLDGKWFAFTKSDDANDFFAMGEMKPYVEGMIDENGADVAVVRVKGKKLAGRQTVGLKEKDAPGVLYVAADGSDEMTGISINGTKITYSGWNKPVKPKAPKNTLDMKDFS